MVAVVGEKAERDAGGAAAAEQFRRAGQLPRTAHQRAVDVEYDSLEAVGFAVPELQKFHRSLSSKPDFPADPLK